MRTVSPTFSGAVSVIVVTLVFVFGIQTPSNGQGSKDKDVRVVNTTAEPVPTTVLGTAVVNVANVPTVVITGTPAVGISPSANAVTIGNTAGAPALVRDVDHQPRELFKFKFESFVSDGQNFAPSESCGR